ncbi:MAG: hypothetical protein R3D71_09240 [Rickettsiales bacterium]
MPEKQARAENILANLGINNTGENEKNISAISHNLRKNGVEISPYALAEQAIIATGNAELNQIAGNARFAHMMNSIGGNPSLYGIEYGVRNSPVQINFSDVIGKRGEAIEISGGVNCNCGQQINSQDIPLSISANGFIRFRF